MNSESANATYVTSEFTLTVSSDADVFDDLKYAIPWGKRRGHRNRNRDKSITEKEDEMRKKVLKLRSLK